MTCTVRRGSELRNGVVLSSDHASASAAVMAACVALAVSNGKIGDQGVDICKAKAIQNCTSGGLTIPAARHI